MVNGYFSRGTHEREIKEFKIIDLMFIYLWYEKDGTDWALTIGRGNTSRIQKGTKSSGSRDVKHRQSLWVDKFLYDMS